MSLLSLCLSKQDPVIGSCECRPWPGGWGCVCRGRWLFWRRLASSSPFCGSSTSSCSVLPTQLQPKTAASTVYRPGASLRREKRTQRPWSNPFMWSLLLNRGHLESGEKPPDWTLTMRRRSKSRTASSAMLSTSMSVTRYPSIATLRTTECMSEFTFSHFGLHDLKFFFPPLIQQQLPAYQLTHCTLYIICLRLMLLTIHKMLLHML